MISEGVCFMLERVRAGTDNKELLQSQFYVGSKHERVRGDAYYELLDEFITAAQRR